MPGPSLSSFDKYLSFRVAVKMDSHGVGLKHKERSRNSTKLRAPTLVPTGSQILLGPETGMDTIRYVLASFLLVPLTGAHSVPF